MADQVGAEILRLRQERKLPPLTYFHTSAMREWCGGGISRNHLETGIHYLGGAGRPIKGTDLVVAFDATAPLTATSQMEAVAQAEVPRGKNGKLAIDDAHRLAVEVCPLENPARYRILVGYWYSKLGVFLDYIPRGDE